MTKLQFENDKEFENYISGGNYEVSKLIVKTAEKLKASKKQELVIAKVYTKEDGMIYEITLNKKDVVNTLKQNINIYEREEDYIGCQKIVDLINYFQKH